MTLDVKKVDLEAILALRALFLREANHQIRYNAVHERGWSDSYLVAMDGRGLVALGRIFGPYRDDASWILARQRGQQNCLHNGEDGTGGSNSSSSRSALSFLLWNSRRSAP